MNVIPIDRNVIDVNMKFMGHALNEYLQTLIARFKHSFEV